MYDSTFTFKTRRKHHFLLICLLILVQSITSYAIPIQCPDPCECYVNHNGIPSARCSEVYPNQSPFPNIHVLVLYPSETQDECNIPKDIAEIFPQLNFLYMTNCSLTNIPSNIFKGLQSLQEVDLSNNHIKKLDSSTFINNNQLRYVNLHNNPFHIADRPFLISKSLWELDLTSCSIHEIPYNMFKNLTHLKYLTLYDNKLKKLDENTLPNSLKTINLGKNLIKNVPTVELERIKGIRKIDLSENPVYCTCSLINFQSSMSSNRAVTFPNEIVCAKPREYSGHRLIDLPEYELCDAVIQASNDGCDDGDICTNQIPPEEEKNKNHDKILDDFERDQVVPVDKKVVNYMDEMQSDSADEGSGDGDSTETPDIKIDQPKTEPENKPVTDEPKPSPETEVTTEPPKPSETHSEEVVINQPKENVTEKNNDVTMYPNEIASSTNTTTEKHDETFKEEVPTTPVIIPEAQPIPESTVVSIITEGPADTIPSSSEKPAITDTPETETIKLTPENKTHDEGSENVGKLQSNQPDSSIFNLGYIIPCLAILVVIIICLGVYLGQRSSHKNNWDPKDGNSDGAEMQDASLLTNKTKTPIVKSTKYPSEGTSEQTERLMGESPTAPSAWQLPDEPIGNGNATHDADKLPNGNDKEPIERVTTKVTTLPDSIPRTPVIRNT